LRISDKSDPRQKKGQKGSKTALHKRAEKKREAYQARVVSSLKKRPTAPTSGRTKKMGRETDREVGGRTKALLPGRKKEYAPLNLSWERGRETEGRVTFKRMKGRRRLYL